jgi:hypothetical protein
VQVAGQAAPLLLLGGDELAAELAGGPVALGEVLHLPEEAEVPPLGVVPGSPQSDE